MGTRPFKKPDKERHDEVIFIGRARSPKYDYRPYIQRAFTQGNIECLQSIPPTFGRLRIFKKSINFCCTKIAVNF